MILWQPFWKRRKWKNTNTYKDNNSTKNDQKITHTKTPIYIPYGIGCGLGGANWEDIETRIKDLDITVVKL